MACTHALGIAWNGGARDGMDRSIGAQHVERDEAANRTPVLARG
jgi:hypothetical protein